MRGSRPQRTMHGTDPTESRAMMTSTDARVEALAAAVRAVAQVLTPEQSSLASALFLRHVEHVGRQPLSGHADQAASAEVVSVMLALAR